MRALIKLVGTPQATAIYNELWEVAEAVQSGNLIAAQELVGLSEEDSLDHLEKALALARKFKAERDEAKTSLKSTQGNIVSMLKLYGYISRDIIAECPKILDDARDWIATLDKPGRLPTFPPAGQVTCYLQELGVTGRKVQQLGNDGWVTYFDKESVERVLGVTLP